MDLDSLRYRQLVIEGITSYYGLDEVAANVSVTYERKLADFRRNDVVGFALDQISGQDEIGSYFQVADHGTFYNKGVQFMNRKGLVT